jgi:thiol-disulfide isomerase/thioredoxin
MHLIHVDNENSLNSYNNKIKKYPAMVLFYMPGCTHCEAMKPQWEKFEYNVVNGKNKKTLQKSPIMVARVRNDYLPRVNGHTSVRGYPTIFKLKNGNLVDEYTGNRHHKDFEQDLMKFLRSVSSSRLTSQLTSPSSTSSTYVDEIDTTNDNDDNDDNDDNNGIGMEREARGTGMGIGMSITDMILSRFSRNSKKSVKKYKPKPKPKKSAKKSKPKSKPKKSAKKSKPKPKAKHKKTSKKGRR